MEHRRLTDRELSPTVTAEGTTTTTTTTTTAAPAEGGDGRGESLGYRFGRGSENGKSDVEKLIPEVRASDIEPYTGLRYLSRLFKLMGVILVLLLVAEVITGLSTQGTAAIPTLLGEASRLLVFAGLLWGSGDLAHLLIDMGHDIRATRILNTRLVHHTVGPKAAKAVVKAVAAAQEGSTGHAASASIPPDTR